MQVRFIQTQNLIMDTNIDMTNCIQSQNTKDSSKFNTKMEKKECQVAEERTKSRFTEKEK